MSAKKPNIQNLITGIVVGLALIMALTVILVKTGVLKKTDEAETGETVIESEVVVVSDVDENGETYYYTMVQTYVRPKVSSNHRYPVTKSSTKPHETETTIEYVEVSSVVAICDENGNPLYDESGDPVTQVVTYTVPQETTGETEPTTEYIPRTDSVVVTDPILHKPKKDKEGNPLTEVVTLDPPPSTKADLWSENIGQETTTKNGLIPDITTNVSRDDALAESIISQINEDRTAQGLPALSSSSGLKGAARTNSLAMAVPELYNKDTSHSKLYSYTTSYGGKSLYNVISTSGGGSTSMSESVSSVGVGVIKSNGKYYTTIIFE